MNTPKELLLELDKETQQNNPSYLLALTQLYLTRFLYLTFKDEYMRTSTFLFVVGLMYSKDIKTREDVIKELHGLHELSLVSGLVTFSRFKQSPQLLAEVVEDMKISTVQAIIVVLQTCCLEVKEAPSCVTRAYQKAVILMICDALNIPNERDRVFEEEQMRVEATLQTTTYQPLTL